mgnify:FL=1
MISIVIPTYEMHGRGVEFLNELWVSICSQTYEDYEVIVSDDSVDNQVRDYCVEHGIDYYRHTTGHGAAMNLNNAISHATGTIIKPMFQDDQFLDTDCLTKVGAMTGKWCVLTSAHLGSDRGDHVPYPAPPPAELATGVNTFGSPSAVAWKRNNMAMDTNLQWLFDCDFYARMLIQNGQPEFIPAKVLIREWDGMATRTNAAGQVRVMELEYIKQKYGEGQ